MGFALTKMEPLALCYITTSSVLIVLYGNEFFFPKLTTLIFAIFIVLSL